MNSKSFGQTTKDTICITKSEFRFLMKELNDYNFLRLIDSTRIVVIANKDSIINKQKIIIKNQNILLHLEKKKRNRQGWIVGGSLGGALIVGILTSFLLR